MSLEDIPQWLADAWDINLGTAQVIISIIVIFAILLPYLVLDHKKPSAMISLILLFLAECLLVGLGWLPFWVLIMSAVMGAFAVAFLGQKIGGD